MPKELEDKLRSQADKFLRAGKLKGKKGESGKEKKDRYVYSTLTKLQKEGKIKPWRKLKK